MKYRTEDEKNGTVTLDRFDGCGSGDDIVGPYALILDIEMTGLDVANDEIIEIGCRMISVHCVAGEYYAAMQEPMGKISREITLLTGLTADDLAGQSIDWRRVGWLIQGARIVISHSAAFDRPFIDRYCPESRSALWGCSLADIPWLDLDMPKKLEMIMVSLGKYYDAHRAMIDADALAWVLMQRVDSGNDDLRFLDLVLERSIEPTVLVEVVTSYERKESVKALGYGWNPSKKNWVKTVRGTEVDDHLAELRALGMFPRASEINPANRFQVSP